MAKIWLDSIEKQKKKEQLELCVIDGQTDRRIIIRDCCKFLDFSLPSDQLVKKCDKFSMRYRNCSDLHPYFGIVMN